MSIKRFSDRHPPDLSRWFAGTGKTFSREVWARDKPTVYPQPPSFLDSFWFSLQAAINIGHREKV
jgi:hypothetical protein